MIFSYSKPQNTTKVTVCKKTGGKNDTVTTNGKDNLPWNGFEVINYGLCHSVFFHNVPATYIGNTNCIICVPPKLNLRITLAQQPHCLYFIFLELMHTFFMWRQAYRCICSMNSCNLEAMVTQRKTDHQNVHQTERRATERRGKVYIALGCVFKAEKRILLGIFFFVQNRIQNLQEPSIHHYSITIQTAVSGTT